MIARPPSTLKAAAVIALVLLSTLPLGAGQPLLDPDVPVCGRVVNEVGWTLDGVRVTGLGTGTRSARHAPPPGDVTDRDGTFAFEVIRDRYQVVFSDNRTPLDRAQATYVQQRASFDADDDDEEDGVCGAGPGEEGVALGTITLATSPGIEFVQVNVTDEVAGGPVADATVTVQVQGTPWAQATTGQGGTARLTCPSDASYTVQVQGEAFETGEETGLTCSKDLQFVDLGLFRSPVPVRGNVTDADTGDPLEGADVQATPENLDPGQGPYDLDVTTDQDGTYVLEVPGGDRYEIDVRRDRYDNETATVDVPRLDDVNKDIALLRVRVDVAGQVTDVDGDGIQAEIGFDGPVTKTEQTSLDGTFSVNLPHGAYDVAIDAAGFNDRTCSLDVDLDGSAFSPPDCLRLIPAGKGVLEGVVTDALTDVPLQDVAVGFDAATDQTDADGLYRFVVDPQTSAVTVDRTGYEPVDEDRTVDLDEVTTFDIVLNRTTVQRTFHVVNATTGADVGNAHVVAELIRDGTVQATFEGDAGADGKVTLELEWTSDNGTLDAGDYRVRARRTGSAPIYEEQICLTGIEVNRTDTASTVTDCPVEAVPALGTTVGPIIDAHDGTAIQGVDVNATHDDAAACQAPYDCQATTGTDGTATLQLPRDRTFNVELTHDRYQSPDGRLVQAGNAVFVDADLARRTRAVDVPVRDAHTGSPVETATVQAQGVGFTCDVGDEVTCQATTDAQGNAQLDLPWGDLDLAVPAGTHDVHTGLETESDVRFQSGTGALTVTLAAGADPAPVRLLRDAAGAIHGPVLDYQGNPVAGASLDVTSVRPEPPAFSCNPADHDSPGAFPDCAGDDAGDGTYSLVLPHGTLDDHAWDLTVTAAGHHTERADDVQGPAHVPVTLWPTEFDLTVHVRDLLTGERLDGAQACIADLEAGQVPVPGRCRGNGDDPDPIVFEDVRWQRDDRTNETDLFSVRGEATDYLDNATVVQLGPAADVLDVFVVPASEDILETGHGRITGQVLDGDAATAADVTGAVVTATRQDGPCFGIQDAYRTTTMDGRYDLAVPCSGTYNVTVDHPLYASASGTVQVQEGPEVLDPVRLPGTSYFNATLDRGTGEAVVEVVDLVGAQAVPGATVALEGLDVAADPPNATTAADGTATFTDLPWGTYEATVTGPADRDWVLGSPEVPSRTVVEVRPQRTGSTTAVLVGQAADCAPGTGTTPDLCDPSVSDPAVQLLQLDLRRSESGDPTTGTWVLVPPTVGAPPLSASSTSTVDVDNGQDPDDGTWTFVLVPDPAPAPEQELEVTATVEPGPTVLTASVPLVTVVPGTGQGIYAPLVWTVNVHRGSSVACVPPTLATCDAPQGTSPSEVSAMRFYTL